MANVERYVIEYRFSMDLAKVFSSLLEQTPLIVLFGAFNEF